jgi:3-oxoadipate enol-lactonase
MASTDRFTERPGARVRFRDDGDGPAVLLIHGWALDLEMWEPQVAALAPRFRLVRFDRRGFGLSTGDPSLEGDVHDALALMDELGLRRAALVGMSQGARVALRAALAAPDRVPCLVIDGAPDELALDPRTAGDEIPIDEYRRIAAREGVAAVRREWSRHPFARLATGDAAARELLDRMVARYPGRDLLEPHPPAPSPLTTRLRALAAPALVINGARDSDVRRLTGDDLSGVIPTARRVLVPDAGHLPNLDAPRFYSDVLSTFFMESFDASN